MRFNVILDAISRISGTLKKVKVNNFCREGIGVLSTDPFSDGENVEIELKIPGDNIPVVCRGEITWTKSLFFDNMHYKSGVKFKEITNGDRNRILEHVYKQWIMPAKVKGNSFHG